VWKKLGLALAVLLVLIAGAAWYLFSNLDGLIKTAIEKYGSAATAASVTVDNVDLSLSSGAGSINGLVVGNPAGFATPHALSLGSVGVQVDTSSIAGSGPIVIDEVTISQPQITYEVQGLSTNSNLKAIQNNVQAFAASTVPAQQQQAQQSSSAPARKEIIRDLIITGGEIGISSSALNGKALTVPLPVIHLTNIGENGGGASPAEIAQQVLGAITSSASKVSATALTKQVEALATGVLSNGPGVLKTGAGALVNGSVTGTAKGLLGY
jgi:hypothetical protein